MSVSIELADIERYRARPIVDLQEQSSLLGAFVEVDVVISVHCGSEMARFQCNAPDYLLSSVNAISAAFSNPGECVEIGGNFGADHDTILIDEHGVVQFCVFDENSRTMKTIQCDPVAFKQAISDAFERMVEIFSAKSTGIESNAAYIDLNDKIGRVVEAAVSD